MRNESLPRSETPTQADFQEISLAFSALLRSSQANASVEVWDRALNAFDALRRLANDSGVAPVSAEEEDWNRCGCRNSDGFQCAKCPQHEGDCKTPLSDAPFTRIRRMTFGEPIVAGPSAAESEQPKPAGYWHEGSFVRAHAALEHEKHTPLYLRQPHIDSDVASLRSSLEAAQTAFGEMWREDLSLAGNITDAMMDSANDEAVKAQLRADLEAARKALEPFAKLADEYSPDFLPDNFHIWNGLTLGNLRAAARALENLK